MTHSVELSRITEYDAGTVLDAGEDAQVNLDEDASGDHGKWSSGQRHHRHLGDEKHLG
ncbi:hypothetical protein [Cutibacterium avidum]|uniref:hypothetical protein n=1 Tax=Cutibacterium avidum TaxID=33010 RepID=UPI002FF1B3D3